MLGPVILVENQEEPVPLPQSQDDFYREQLGLFFAWARSAGHSDAAIAAAFDCKEAYIVQLRNFTKRSRSFLKFIETYKTKHVEHDSTADDIWGAYNRRAQRGIEGHYQLIRPSREDNGDIAATDFEIFWSEAERCLAFKQQPLPGPPFSWNVCGNIAYMHFRGIFHFVSTDHAYGRHQMMSGRYDVVTKSFSALSLALSSNWTPCCMPVKLIPWDRSAKINGILSSDHSEYSNYREHLDKIVQFTPATLTTIMRGG